MAFANLFSGLSALSEDAGKPRESPVTSSNRWENRPRGTKRKTNGEQAGSDRKSKDNFNHRGNPYCKAESGFPGQKYTHSFNSSYNSGQSCNAENTQTKGDFNLKNEINQGKKKKKKKKKNQQHNTRRAKVVITKQEKPKFMSQEFKEQNALLVNGRLVCRHFVFGRCIKEDECQLEHFQVYNGVIKEVCKFYIQGFCLRGETCPYMHNSFPCKFFHRKGKCLQEQNCRFSHEPLDEITEKLLDEVIEQEQVFFKLAKKAKEESSEQQANTEENRPTEENKNPHFLTQPLRPSFYNSADAEKKPDEHQDKTEQCVADTEQPHSSALVTQNQPEPVCYSVEALLGPQLSRNFSSFSKTPASEDYFSVSDTTCANQTKVPYSVEAILSSYIPADNSPIGQTPDPSSEKIVFYAPLRKEEPPPTASVEENAFQQTFSVSLPCLEVKNRLISDPVAPLTRASEKQLEGKKTSSEKDLYRPKKSAEIKPSLAVTKHNEISRNHPTQLPPNVSKRGVAVAVPDALPINCSERRDAADVSGYQSRLSGGVLDSKKKHLHVFTETPEHNSTGILLKSCRETPNHGDFSDESSKTPKRKFSSLFTCPLSGVVGPGSDSLTAAIKPQRSEDVRKPSLSFLSLFASPLSETPPSLPRLHTRSVDSAASPCRQPSGDDAASNSNQTESDWRFLPSKVGTLTEQESPKSSPPSAPVFSIVSTAPSYPSSPKQNLSDISSPKAPSVLQSLFVQLSPFPEDRERHGSAPSRNQSIG